ncbi:MAG: hypothetical protein LLG97_08095 [Deltaproteobacteria bacterium]|nr:hypothetical protein [Deltaproteobacteria bacterium]
MVQSTVTVAGLDSSLLTLYAGTRIALIRAGGVIETPVSLDNVTLSLVAPSGTLPTLPDGINALTSLRIRLTIDSAEQEAWFWPTDTSGTAEQGLKLVVVVSATDVKDGALGLLFDVASGSAVRVGSSALTSLGETTPSAVTASLRVPLELPPSTPGSRQMAFSPGRTGSYKTGGSTPGSGSAPGGTFWSLFNVPDPGCATVGTIEVCGAKKVESVEITEESTADILADCVFGESNTATSGTIPPGYQFWCERIPKGDGSTDIKISSPQANLPIIRAKIVRASDNLPMFWTYHQATGGLNGPDGTVYSDPYQKKEFEFAGDKKLTFTTKADKKYDWMRQHALQPLLDAGYTAWQRSFQATNPGFIAEIMVVDTLDARVLMEENVILKEPWKVRKGDATRGNRGTYDYTPKYKGTAKASMKFPNTSNLVYEISADVTFEKDSALSTETMDVYTASGTITQTNYTVPSPFCSGEPASFTDAPYPIAKDPYGDLWIKVGSNPIEYVASATLSAGTYPLQSHPYTMCCYSQCSDEVLEPGAQEHMWLMTGLGGAFKTAGTDGRLKGTFQHVTEQGINAGFYEWDFAPADENQ